MKKLFFVITFLVLLGGVAMQLVFTRPSKMDLARFYPVSSETFFIALDLKEHISYQRTKLAYATNYNQAIEHDSELYNEKATDLGYANISKTS